MSTLLVAVAGALVAGGLLALGAGLAARPVPPARPRRTSTRRSRLSPRTRMLAGIGLGLGALVAVLTGWVIALVIAPLLQEKIRGLRFFRSAFALPFAFSVATASVIFGVLYNPASGVINGLLSYVGLGPYGWLTDPGMALISVSLATVWMQLGYNLLILSAGLGAMPDDVLEAARLDGAGHFRTLWQVLVPLARPAVVTLVVLEFMWTWNEFLIPLVMLPSNEGLRTAPLGLGFFQGQYTQGFALLAAGALIVATPIVIVYLFLQRHFIAGMLEGAVKD